MTLELSGLPIIFLFFIPEKRPIKKCKIVYLNKNRTTKTKVASMQLLGAKMEGNNCDDRIE